MLPKKLKKCRRCDKPSEVLAVGRASDEDENYRSPHWYCADCANYVADRGFPEYHANCPACGCLFGVN